MFRTAYARTLTIGVAAMFVGLLAAPLVGAQVASAQEPPPVRIRGTIERVDGVTSVIKARHGAELKVTVADNAQIAGIIKASQSDIKQNSFCRGHRVAAARRQPQRRRSHIFPESMRGTCEGH